MFMVNCRDVRHMSKARPTGNRPASLSCNRVQQLSQPSTSAAGTQPMDGWYYPTCVAPHTRHPGCAKEDPIRNPSACRIIMCISTDV